MSERKVRKIKTLWKKNKENIQIKKQTHENKEKIENMEGVAKVLPIGDQNFILGSDYRDDGYILEDGFDFSNLDYKRYNVEEYKDFLTNSNNVRLTPNLLLDPIEINNDVPIKTIRTSGVPIENIIYGDLPKQDNEIMISLDYAIYLASQMNLDNLENLVDKNISLNAKKDKAGIFYEDSNKPISKLSYIISGIYIPSYNNGTSGIVYPYNSNDSIVLDNNLGLDHPKIWFEQTTYEEVAYDAIYDNYPSDLEYISMDKFRELYPDEKYYQGFYIKTKSSEDIDNLSKKIETYDPHIEIINNYEIENGSNYLMFKTQIRNILILIFIIFIIFLIVIIFLLKYYNLSLKFNKENLSFYSYSKKEIESYITFERSKLFKLILFIVILFIILAILIKSFISIFLFLILLCVILVLLKVLIKEG